MTIIVLSYHDVLARAGALGYIPAALVLTIAAFALYSSAVTAVEGRRRCAGTRMDLTPEPRAPFIDRRRRQERS